MNRYFVYALGFLALAEWGGIGAKVMYDQHVRNQILEERLLLTTEFLESTQRCLAHGVTLEHCLGKDVVRSYYLQEENYHILGFKIK